MRIEEGLIGMPRRESTSETIARLKVERDQWKATLRDQFAMAALQGLLASCLRPDKARTAEEAYQAADAMLAAREGEEG